MKSSQAAFNLIVAEEDSDEAYYVRHYEHFEWPAGASGPTVGIGYDCGYVRVAELRADWSGIVDDETVAALERGCGLQGGAAHAFVQVHGGSVTITWDQAIKEFADREMPKWEGRVTDALSNTGMLSGDSFGALVSLAYNRGSGGFSMPGPRYAEERQIRALMAAKDFAAIPDQFLSMRRLWPEGGDLYRRRGHEAALFKQGLSGAPADPLPLKPKPPAPPVVAPPQTLVWAQQKLKADGLYSGAIDGAWGPQTHDAMLTLAAKVFT
jgi:hypothetical protein